jgi:RNA polymerase sigma-70 factor, ECF subfamily
MSVLRMNAMAGLPLDRAAVAPRSAKSPEAELEVTRLFGESRTSLLRYILSLGLPIADGEEIIQETFLGLFRHLRLGKPRENLRGWIFCVAHNLALKRRHVNQRARIDTDRGRAVGESRLDPSPNPEEQIVCMQRKARLQAVLRALPEQDRCCLLLHAEGLRYREIARILGISLGAVSVSLTRSLQRLRCADEK